MTLHLAESIAVRNAAKKHNRIARSAPSITRPRLIAALSN